MVLVLIGVTGGLMAGIVIGIVIGHKIAFSDLRQEHDDLHRLYALADSIVTDARHAQAEAARVVDRRVASDSRLEMGWLISEGKRIWRDMASLLAQMEAKQVSVAAAAAAGRQPLSVEEIPMPSAPDGPMVADLYEPDPALVAKDGGN